MTRTSLLLLPLAFVACLDPDRPGYLVPATVVDDPDLPALQLDDTRLHLETFGDPADPVIIVLHGGPGNDYSYLLRLVEPRSGPSLADEYFVVFFDQRGAGLSQRHPASEVSLAHYLTDLETVVDEFAPGRQVVLLGHSWGGQYAAQYMQAHPERIRGAVLAEPGPLRSDIEQVSEDFDFDFTAEHLGDYLWGRQIVSSRDHESADYYASLLLLEETNERVEEPSPNWRLGAVVLLQLYLDELEGTSWDFATGLSEVQPEVLFIVGERSHDLGAELQLRQIGLFGRARMHEIANAGHSDVVYAKAEETLGVVLDYLAALPPEGA